MSLPGSARENAERHGHAVIAERPHGSAQRAAACRERRTHPRSPRPARRSHGDWRRPRRCGRFPSRAAPPLRARRSRLPPASRRTPAGRARRSWTAPPRLRQSTPRRLDDRARMRAHRLAADLALAIPRRAAPPSGARPGQTRCAVWLRPTSGTSTSPPSSSIASARKNAAEERSPGTSMSSGPSRASGPENHAYRRRRESSRPSPREAARCDRARELARAPRRPHRPPARRAGSRSSSARWRSSSATRRNGDRLRARPSAARRRARDRPSRPSLRAAA